MTIKDNPIDTTIDFCDEECCLFRWSKCETKNEDETCDKPDRYDQGDEFYPSEYIANSELSGGKSLRRSWNSAEIEKQLEDEEDFKKRKTKSLLRDSK